MPKFTPKPGTNWVIEVLKHGADGKIKYNINRKLIKIKIKMGHRYLANGMPQDSYFPQGHPHAGVFEGIAVIFQEHGYTWANDLNAECPKFKCAEGAT